MKQNGKVPYLLRNFVEENGKSSRKTKMGRDGKRGGNENAIKKVVERVANLGKRNDVRGRILVRVLAIGVVAVSKTENFFKNEIKNDA